MRRVNLDAFWKSEKSTVAHNCSQITRCLKTQVKFGMPHILPVMGPFPLEDTLGMKAAIAVLDKSLDKGTYAATVQWATFRRMRSAITNLHQASSGGMSDRVGAFEKSKTWITSTPTFGFFFSRFMIGIHHRVGETVIRDEPVTIELLQAIESYLHEKWREANQQVPVNMHRLLKIAQQGTWYTAGFCSALRGEEMVMMELAGTRSSIKFLSKPLGTLKPHFDLVVAGRTKGCRISGAKFKIPICGTTEFSKIRPGIWITRLCSILTRQGRTHGYLFGTTDDHEPKVGEFHDLFYEVLEGIQDTRPNLIGPEVDVRDLYGILRTLRRSATAHATNRRVPKDIIEAVNRWRTERKSDVPVLDMHGVYARLDLLKPTVLLYSLRF